MTFTCPNCGQAFAHASSLSRHKKDCGGGSSCLPCPHCATTFTRESNLRRHVNRTCKKRPASEKLPENPLLPEKRPLVDYASSEEEPMEVEPFQPTTMSEHPVHPFQSWRTTGSDTESEEEEPSPPSDEEPWYEQQQPLETSAEEEEELWEPEKE